MNTQASGINPPPPFGAPPRPLAEDVLQSAEEAVLTNPVSVDTLQGEPLLAPVPPDEVEESYTRQLARQVGEKPVLSALLALASGALLAVALKSALQRRRY